MSDDFERAVLITFNFNDALDPNLKVRRCAGLPWVHGSTAEPPCTGAGGRARHSAVGARSTRHALPCLPLPHVHARRRAVPLQAQATSFVNEIKKSPDCWMLCTERFSVTPYPEVKFWCLQTLHEVRACVCHRPALSTRKGARD